MRPALALGSDRVLLEFDDGMMLICDSADRRNLIRLLKAAQAAPRLAAFVRDTVESTWTCLDIAAGIGETSCVLGRVATQGAVHAFEANPLAWQLLNENVIANEIRRIVVPCRAAVGRRAQFAVPRLDDAGSAVPTLTLDAYWRGVLAGGRVDLVRIGGGALPSDVLAGATDLLTANPDCHVVIDWDPERIESSGPRGTEAGRLVRASFRPSLIDPDGVVRKATWSQVKQGPPGYVLATRSAATPS